MRTSMNSTELLIWSRLRGRQVDGWKFRRQHPIGPYFVDFYCASARLVVEIDGPDHGFEPRIAHDQRRQAWLEAQGYRVLRINVSEISSSLDDVMEWIYIELLDQEARGFARRPHRPAAPGTSPQARKSY
jgi:very-short-patch-repair endonuclease